jgi:hypothetical protein
MVKFNKSHQILIRIDTNAVAARSVAITEQISFCVGLHFDSNVLEKMVTVRLNFANFMNFCLIQSIERSSSCEAGSRLASQEIESKIFLPYLV